jgi:hypothetical protein
MNEQSVYSLCISFIVSFYSGLPGLWIAEIMRKKKSPFFNGIKNFELTKNSSFYKLLGLDFFTYCIKNTFFRHFNTKIRITKRPNINEINDLLNEVTISEICHLLGFMFVLIFQIISLITLGSYHMILFSSIFNTIFNVYPVLLQERNKLKLKNFSNNFTMPNRPSAFFYK